MAADLGRPGLAHTRLKEPRSPRGRPGGLLREVGLSLGYLSSSAFVAAAMVQRAPCSRRRPTQTFASHFVSLRNAKKNFCFPSHFAKHTKRETTLSGGSLGSCVDEERSQLRELM